MSLAGPGLSSLPATLTGSPPARRGLRVYAVPRAGIPVFAAVVLIALWLRLWNIGATLESSDQAAMAYLVRHSYGLAWIFAHDYGPVLPLIQRTFAEVASRLGVPMGEAVARLPVALISLAQVALTWALVRRLRVSRVAAVGATLACAVLPTLVAGAHYPWGYNTTWLMTGTLALWATLAWLDEPRPWLLLLAGTALALHCLSGLYSLALPLTLLLAWTGRHRSVGPESVCKKGLQSDDREGAAGLRSEDNLFVTGATQTRPTPSHTRSESASSGAARECVQAGRRVGFLSGFVLPCLVALGVIALSWYATGGGPVGRLLGKTEMGTLGWHPEQILRLPALWVSQFGYVFGIVAASGLVYGLILLGRGRREGLLAFWAVVGLLPLLLLASWDRIGYPAHYFYEVVYPSALLGAVLLAAMWRAGRAWRGVAIVAAGLSLGQLAVGSAGVCLPGTPFRTWTGVATGWGNIRPDSGAKAAGLYVRTHVPPDAIILALHTNDGMELPVAEYYLGRKVLADYDLPASAAPHLVERFHATADVIIVEAERAGLVEALPAFQRVATFTRDGEAVRLIYARRSLALPRVRDEVARCNDRYDELYRPRRVPVPLAAPDHFVDVLGRYQEAVRACKAARP